jgi:hypothetical protein
MLGVGLLLQHLAGVGGEAGPVVAELEPSPLPVRVVGCHRARDVELLARVP